MGSPLWALAVPGCRAVGVLWCSGPWPGVRRHSCVCVCVCVLISSRCVCGGGGLGGRGAAVVLQVHWCAEEEWGAGVGCDCYAVGHPVPKSLIDSITNSKPHANKYTVPKPLTHSITNRHPNPFTQQHTQCHTHTHTHKGTGAWRCWGAGA